MPPKRVKTVEELAEDFNLYGHLGLPPEFWSWIDDLLRLIASQQARINSLEARNEE